MLNVNQLSVRYGHHQALRSVALNVNPAEIVVILGANGAGKTTLLKSLGGLVTMDNDSQVKMNQFDLGKLPPHQIVESGLALVPEGRGIFGDLTVRENLKLGAYPKRARAHEEKHYKEVLELFPRLEERLDQVARTMSGGEQQMVAIGRALMSAPEVLLLDEPSLGLSPLFVGELFKALERIKDNGVGVLLVEQNAVKSLEIADRAYVLENGAVVASGDAEQMRTDKAVQDAYLGAA